MDKTKVYYFILYLCLFLISQTFTIIGAFITLPYKNLTFWQAYKMAIPFSWIGWLFLTYAIYIVNKYNFITNTQILFLIIFIQFTLVLIANKYFLKEDPSLSDIIAFIIVFIGYLVSVNNYFSKLFGIKITNVDNEEREKKEKKEDEQNIEQNIELNV